MSSPNLSALVLSARSEVANATRVAHRDPDRLDRARERLHALNIERAIASNQCLSDADRARLADLLTGGSAK